MARIVSTDDAALRLQFVWKGPPDTPLPDARYQAWMMGLLVGPFAVTGLYLLGTPVQVATAVHPVAFLSLALSVTVVLAVRLVRRVDGRRDTRRADEDDRPTAPPVNLRRLAVWGAVAGLLPFVALLLRVSNVGPVRALLALTLGLALTVRLVRKVGPLVTPTRPLRHHLGVLLAELNAPRARPTVQRTVPVVLRLPAPSRPVTVTVPDLTRSLKGRDRV